MVALKIYFESECRRTNKAPDSFQLLKDLIFSYTGLLDVTFKYEDEEGDEITISSESEYFDFLSFSNNIAKLHVHRVKKEQSCETFPVKTKSSSSSSVPIKSDQGISTRVLTEDRSQGTSKPKMQESGCDPEEPSNKFIETIPLYTSSVLSGSDIKTSDKFTSTKSNLLESIRMVIREEIGKPNLMKASGIMLKHFGVKCSSCNVCPIVGIRYKCSVCEVNYCEECEFAKDHEHPFFKVRKPEFVPRDEVKNIKEGKNNVRENVEQSLSAEREKKGRKDGMVQGSVYEFNVKKIMEMGFNAEQALDALVKTNNHFESAVDNLLLSL